MCCSVGYVCAGSGECVRREGTTRSVSDEAVRTVTVSTEATDAAGRGRSMGVGAGAVGVLGLVVGFL